MKILRRRRKYKKELERKERKNRKELVVKKLDESKIPVVPVPGPSLDYTDSCMKCQQVDQASIENDDIKWIEFDNCGQWYHIICLGIVPELVEDLNETYFVCENCL